MKDPNRLTRNLDEAAAILGVDEKSLRNHMDAATATIPLGGDEVLRCLRIGRRVLVPVAELERVTGSRVP